MHVDTPGQDTQNNWPVGASGFGLGTFAHPDPDALAPAGTASAVAVTATDTMTAKKTRNRTGRMGPPLPAPGCQSAAEVTGPYTCTSRLVNGDEWTISIGHAACTASHRHRVCLGGSRGLLHSLTGAKYEPEEGVKTISLVR